MGMLQENLYSWSWDIHMASLMVILHSLIYFIRCLFVREYKKNKENIKKQTNKHTFFLVTVEKNISQFRISEKIQFQWKPKKPRLCFLLQGYTSDSQVFSAFHSQIKLNLINQLPSCCHGDSQSTEQKLSVKSHASEGLFHAIMHPDTRRSSNKGSCHLSGTCWSFEKEQNIAKHKVNLKCSGIQPSRPQFNPIHTGLKCIPLFLLM